jgi:hypothetical protein
VSYFLQREARPNLEESLPSSLGKVVRLLRILGSEEERRLVGGTTGIAVVGKRLADLRMILQCNRCLLVETD